MSMPVRFRAAWLCLRCKPVAYRISMENGGIKISGASRGLIAECSVKGAAGYAFTIGASEHITVVNCRSSQ